MQEFIFDFRKKDEAEVSAMKTQLIDSLKNKSYEGLMIVSSDLHSIWNEIVASGVHIGIRGARWNIVKDIPVISVNGTKVVLAKNEDDTRYSLFTSGSYSTNEVAILEDYQIVDLKDPKLPEYLARLDGRLQGWDYETRGFPLEPGFKPLGFSLVADDFGIYIDIRHHTDYDADEYKIIKDYIIKNQRNLITYNLRFETHCFLDMFDTWIYPLDAMAALAADDMHTNLKAAAQMYLSVPSWDDELDYEQKLCDEYSRCKENNPEHAKEIKEEILNRRKEIDPEADLSLYSSLDEGIGNSWEMCYPLALARYCILDSYYTLKIYEKVAPKYSQLCLDIFHKNFYQESYLSATPMPIKVHEAEELFKNALVVNRNADLMVNRIYGELLEQKFGDLNFESVLSPVDIALIETGQLDLLTSTPEKILKKIVCKYLETKDAKLLARIYGKIGACTILTSGITLEDRRKKKVWTELAEKLHLEASTESVIKKFNYKFNKDYIDIIEKYNSLAEQMCPLKSKDMNKMVKYRRILQMTDQELNKLGNPKLIDFFKAIPEKNKKLFMDWISPKNMEYILTCMNPKFPTLKAKIKFNKLKERASYQTSLESLILKACGEDDFEDDLIGFSKGNFTRYRDWIPFQYICDLIIYRANKKYYDILDEMTLYDPRLLNPAEISVPNPDKGGPKYQLNLNWKNKMCEDVIKDYPSYETARTSILKMISLTSESESFRLLDLLEDSYSDIMGRYAYLSDQLTKYEKKFTWDDFIRKDYDKSLNVNTRALIYPVAELKEDAAEETEQSDETTSIRKVITNRKTISVSVCLMWENLYNNGYLKHGYDKLTMETGEKLFYVATQYLWIRFGSDKELSPYLFGNSGFNTKRYKVTKRTNNYAVIDHNEKGEGFEVKFNVAEKSTR